MNKQEYMIHLLSRDPVELNIIFSNDAFIIDKCDLGLGVFAKRNFDIGDKILTFQGELIDFIETRRRGPWECMPIQIGTNVYIDTEPPGIFVNHSCEPNSGIQNDKDLVAITNIQKGEEIRFDYSTTMFENSFTMECQCRKKTCRETIRDFDTLPLNLQQLYLRKEVVMDFIIQLFQIEKVK